VKALFFAGCWLVCGLMGVTASAFGTEAGRSVVARAILDAANKALHGSITVTEIYGSLLGVLGARNVVIRGEDGVVLAHIAQLQVGFGPRDFLGGKINLGQLTLINPRINLVDPRDGRLNFEEVLGLGGPGAGGRAPLITFRDVEIVNGTLTIRTPVDSADVVPEREGGPDGYMRVRRVTELRAHLPYIRLSSPLPSEKGIQIDIAALSAAVSDPTLEVVSARGRVSIRGDTVGLELANVELPDSRGEVHGNLILEQGRLLPDLQIESESVATDDVRGLVSEVPAGLVGRGSLIVRTRDDGGVEFSGERFAVEGIGGGGSARGRLSMVMGPERHWAFRNTQLDLQDFDLEYIRSFFDTLPLAGRVTGRFEADGPKSALNLRFDVVFRDSLVEGWPATTIDGSGTIAIGVPGEIVFRDYELRRASIDMGTARRILPAVDLQGLLIGSGTLNGPWLQLEFDGDFTHIAIPTHATNAHGVVRFDARDETLGVWAELAFDSLNLDGLHTSYPSLTVGGSFVGRAVVSGYVDSLWVDADLEGPAGAVFVEGAFSLLSHRKGTYGLDLRLARLNLKELHPALPNTSLFGRIRGSGVSDSVTGPWAQASAMLRESSIEGVPLDSVQLSAGIADSALMLDTLHVWSDALGVTGSGEIGLWDARRGTITLATETDSVGAIEAILETFLGQIDPEEAAEMPPPSGSVLADVRISGAVSGFNLSGVVEARNLHRAGIYLSRAGVNWSWDGPDGSLQINGAADSLGLGDFGFSLVSAQISGPTDSLGFGARSRFGPWSNEQWIVRGRWIAGDGFRLMPIDLLGFRLATGAWHADSSLVIRVSEEGIDFTEATIASAVTPGKITLNGRLPFEGPGGLTASLRELRVSDLWALLQRDHREVEGEVSGSFSLGGTSDDPTMALTVSLLEGRFGDFTAPQLMGTMAYRSRRVDGDIRVRRMGEEILSIRVELPMNLALGKVDRRQLPGRIAVLARADSVDLSLLDAVTPLVRHVDGILHADLGIAGTWENPELTGSLSIADAVGTYPAIGVRHEDLNGTFRLSGDTIHVEHLTLKSGVGTAQVSGLVRLEELTRPVLDLEIQTQEFHGMDVPDFLALTASGQVRLRGPFLGATLTGRGTVTSGVLYFADMVEKELVSFEDTSLFAESELTLIRTEGLGARLENRFYNSLRVDSLRLEMGSNVWMRSSEANIQLLGSLTVSKVGREYRLNGTLQAPRGIYRLSPGPSLMQLVATREFTVTRGEITYFGTPDLNAAIDIDAEHNVHAVRGEDITVFVNIGGTVYEPRLRFSSDIQPPIAETEVLSYLFFGAPSMEAFAGSGTGAFGNQRLVEQGLNQFLAAVSGQFEYSLISDLNVPLDYVQIRPSVYGRELAGLDLALGKRLGEKWFVTLNPRVCPNRPHQVFTWEDIGASLEYRISRQWNFLVSGDPVQGCSPYANNRLVAKYQLGVDILWEKRY
jgi:translocation and assembly module TamB